MLSAQIDGSEHTQLALNDVVIHWAGDLSMLQMRVYVNGKFLTTIMQTELLLRHRQDRRDIICLQEDLLLTLNQICYF